MRQAKVGFSEQYNKSKYGEQKMKTLGIVAAALLGLFILLGVVGSLAPSNSTATAPSNSTATAPTTAAGFTADLLIARCGHPSLDDSTAYDTPRPPIVSRIIEYKAKKLRFLFIQQGAVGDPPPYQWKLMGVVDMTARDKSKARVVSAEEAAARMPCWVGRSQ
jgi:hypothetical protein